MTYTYNYNDWIELKEIVSYEKQYVEDDLIESLEVCLRVFDLEVSKAQVVLIIC